MIFCAADAVFAQPMRLAILLFLFIYSESKIPEFALLVKNQVFFLPPSKVSQHLCLDCDELSYWRNPDSVCVDCILIGLLISKSNRSACR